MAIDAIVPSELDLPVVSIDFRCVTFREPMTAGVHAWLAGLGKSAPQAVIAQIENKRSARRVPIAPEFPQEVLPSCCEHPPLATPSR